MSYPERSIDPDEPLDDASQRGDKPEWLVHAEQGADEEVEGLERPRARLSLHRPDVPRPSASDAAQQREPEPPKPVAWQAAASSVPRLKEAPTAHKMEGKGPKTSWSAGEREDEDDDGYDPLAPVSEGEDEAPEAATPTRAHTPLRPLDEPFWAVWIDAVRGLPIGIQAAIGVVMLVVAGFFVWPKADPGMSIASMRAHSQQVDGRPVRVRGVVSDVFPMAGGYVYNLHQGKEYVVVYAKGTPPSPKDWVTVLGTANVGYMDGAPRISIFETPPTP